MTRRRSSDRVAWQSPSLGVRAAQAGRPALIELPVAPTAAQARGVAREITRSRTPAYAGLVLRQLPAPGRLRAVLRADVLGPVTAVGVTYLSSAELNGPAFGPRRQTHSRRRPGVGGMAELGIHLVDAVAALGATPLLDAVTRDRRPGDLADLGGVAVGRWGDAPPTRPRRSARSANDCAPGGFTSTGSRMRSAPTRPSNEQPRSSVPIRTPR